MKLAFAKTISAVAITVAALTATASGAADLRKAKPSIQSRSTMQSAAGMKAARIAIKVGCVVNGTPVEFPNDIFIVNQSGVALQARTQVKWNTQNNAFSGVVQLPAMQPGQAHFVSNALPGGLPAGTPCSAKAF